MGAGDVTVEPKLLVLGSALPVIDNRTPASGRSEESAAGDDDAVHAQYWIPGAGQMTWSGLPCSSGRVCGGVATSIQQLDSAQHSQWRPLRLGIAGGALIHFARSLVSAVFFVIAGCLFAAN